MADQSNGKGPAVEGLEPQSVSVSTRIVTEPQQQPVSSGGDGVVLNLDQDEQHLFDTLVNTADAFERGDLSLPEVPNKHVEIRIAGGWVRDKILGKYSHDVDVAVDCLTGKDFATLVQMYIKNKSSNGEKVVGKMGVINANPSQSKHLETATMMVHHVDVDFTNLRGQEVYKHHSRIPTATLFGTPLDDAQRRDFTVNALFFNLRTRQVEDWTRRGIVDLRRGTLVTPLDPMTTFHDDPLRVLRAIRFSVRYNFGLAHNLEQACVSKEVHKSLHVKVSRERVGKELEGMLTGKGAKPQVALQTIARLKLAGSVFCIPTNDSMVGTILETPYVGTHKELSHKRELAWEESCALSRLLPSVYKAHQESLTPTTTKNQASTSKTLVDVRLLHIATFLLPFRHLSFTNHKDKVQSVVSYMIRDGIKLKSKDVAYISTLCDSVDKLKVLLQKGKMLLNTRQNLSTNNSFRLEAGVMLRTTKELWVTGLLLATIDLLRQAEITASRFATTTTNSDPSWLRLCCTVHYAIMEEMKLDQCWKMKPLLDGKAVIAALDLPRGPQVGTYLEEQVKWMLLNPNGSEDECRRYLQQCKRNWENNSSDEDQVGMSDGVGPSSPLHTRKTIKDNEDDNDGSRHFSKKMHVESMDLI